MSKNSDQRRRELEGRSFAARQLNRIYRRDRGVCWLCHKKVKRSEASRDHVIEIGKIPNPSDRGYEWVRDDSNVRLAHTYCNNARSNSKYKSHFGLTFKIGDYVKTS